MEAEADEEPEEARMGCGHYGRQCKIVASCCGDIFGCRFCHDEEKYAGERDPQKRHEIDRFKIAECICLHCDERQPIAQYCRKCDACMGAYFCGVCNFFDDDVSKQAFHCAGCGICRVGGRENYYHCDKCNSCQPIADQGQHHCFEGGMRQNCPICMEYLFDSRQPAQSLRCGHMIHADCARELFSSGNGMAGLRCPVCNVSLMENDTMAAVWSSVDAAIEEQPMPAKYKNIVVRLLCNDCHGESVAKFHFLGLKCGNAECGSYNTRRTGEEDVEAGEPGEEEDEAAAGGNNQ